MPKKTRWEPSEGQFRACGRGPHGEHQGSPVWNMDAAEKRLLAIQEYADESWIETYVTGTWRRVGSLIRRDTPPSIENHKF